MFCSLFIDVVNIGYSPDEIIPEINVVNLRNTFRPTGVISCYTTQGHENPMWIVSNDDYSSGPLMNTGVVTMALGSGNITIEILNHSPYQSDILINTNILEATGNLTCQSQSNSEAQYTVIITTSKNVSYMNIIYKLNKLMFHHLKTRCRVS